MIELRPRQGQVLKLERDGATSNWISVTVYLASEVESERAELCKIATRYGFAGSDLAGWLKMRLIENSELQTELAERDRREGELRAEATAARMRADSLERDGLTIGRELESCAKALHRFQHGEEIEGDYACEPSLKQQAIIDELRSELAALRQQVREVTEWRPMETAPKGDFLLLEKHGTIRIARLFRHGGSVLDDFKYEEGWLPLPPLPKEVERG